jgi:hypothetical protein
VLTEHFQGNLRICDAFGFFVPKGETGQIWRALQSNNERIAALRKTRDAASVWEKVAISDDLNQTIEVAEKEIAKALDRIKYWRYFLDDVQSLEKRYPFLAPTEDGKQAQMFRKWINGYDLKERWAINDIDYLDYLESGELEPHLDFKLIPEKFKKTFIEEARWDLVVNKRLLSPDKIYKWQYKLKDIERIERNLHKNTEPGASIPTPHVGILTQAKEKRYPFLVPAELSPEPMAAPEQAQRKTNYRTDQWDNALPIAGRLYKNNKKITVEEIRNHPPFKACFRDGPPSADRVRKMLNKAGIKLASGKPKKMK